MPLSTNPHYKMKAGRWRSTIARLRRVKSVTVLAPASRATVTDCLLALAADISLEVLPKSADQLFGPVGNAPSCIMRGVASEAPVNGSTSLATPEIGTGQKSSAAQQVRQLSEVLLMCGQ